MTLSPVTQPSAPRTATVELTAKLGADRSERILTVTGPPHVSAALTGGQAVVSAPAGGHFTVALSSLGTGQSAQSSLLGTITLAAGQTLTITPSRWSALAGSTAPARISGGRGPARRLRLRDRQRVPAAHITHVAAHGSSVRVTVEIPALPSAAASVSVSIRATRNRRVLETGIANIAPGKRARRATVTITLRHSIPAGSRLVIAVHTVVGGTTPTEAISTHVSRSA